MKFIVFFVVLFILILLYCFLKERKKNRIIEHYKNFIVVTYDNKPYLETNTKNLIESIKKYNYNFHILGENDLWTGWYGRFKSYQNYISTLDKNEYVLICDGRDVLLNNQSSEEFMKKATSLCNIDEKIIFGAERHCCCDIPERYGRLPSMDNNETLKDVYKNFMEKQVYKDIPNYKYDYFYLNFGVFFGKVENILSMFSNLNMGKNLDDQGMSYIYFYKNPETIYIDANQELIGNNGHNDCHLVLENNKFKNIKTNTYPVLLHFPGDGHKCYETVLKMLT